MTGEDLSTEASNSIESFLSVVELLELSTFFSDFSLSDITQIYTIF